MDINYWLIEKILSGAIDGKKKLQQFKIKGCKKFNISDLPTNSSILATARELINDDEELKILTSILQRKRTRTISGVAPVAVMTSPENCPHGKCICCPGGVDNNTPQSYTGQEPAALRAAMNDFDPYLQTVNRIKQLFSIGHSTSKIDMIIMGGTFPARDPEYQEWFVKRCFDGMNHAGSEGEVTYLRKESPDLITAHSFNETSHHRCTGMTIETRPDYCRPIHVDRMLEQGATRVELGVQSTRERAMTALGRGHTVKDSIEATRVLKDRGMKVCYHIMPGIPGETSEDDLEMFRELFINPDFRPDMIKIYPMVVVAGTKLYGMWKNGEFKPYSLEVITRLIAEMKELVPPYVRIQRIQRDIPAKMIDDGILYTNLRQIVNEYMDQKEMSCSCIRCREWGHLKVKHTDSYQDDGKDLEDPSIRTISYEASGGKEFFISSEDEQGILHGFLRLRIPSVKGDEQREEISKGKTALIREVKVVGPSSSIGKRDSGNIQHHGIGKGLISRAEKIASESGLESILVTSGVGVREYYKNMGYVRNGPYMAKRLTE